MNGIHFVTDAKGRKIAVQLDLTSKMFLFRDRGGMKSEFPWHKLNRPG
jgi:hypothetical protein